MRTALSFIAIATASVLGAQPAHAQERYAVGGDHVAIYNLAGTVEVSGTSGGQVTVEVSPGGADRQQLRVVTGAIDGRQTLRVIYPSDRIVYGTGRGTAQVDVRADGTFGGGGSFRSGRSVRISRSGSGTDAYADLRIGVPRGQRVEIFLAVGSITAENVNGTVRLDTHSGGVSARRMSGSLVIDTGSGAVEVAGMEGDLHVDTGSGEVRVAQVSGRQVLIDTGSGRVRADDVSADRITIDTGSGGIDLRGGSARDVRLDTGSGAVTAELSGALDRLVIDTGSGGVTLALPASVDAELIVDTGSGGIQVDLPMRVTKQGRRELRAVLGAGRGAIRIDTGSGGVRIRAL